MNHFVTAYILFWDFFKIYIFVILSVIVSVLQLRVQGNGPNKSGHTYRTGLNGNMTIEDQG